MKPKTELQRFREKTARRQKKMEADAKWKKLYQPPPIFRTANKIIIGFDGDIHKCGLSAYDALNKKVLSFEDRPLLECGEWLDGLIAKYGKERLFARVEMTDTSTVWGIVKHFFYRLLKSRVATLPKDSQSTFMRIYNSGKSATMGELFRQQLIKRNIPYQLVGSSKRLNIETHGKGLLASYSAINLLIAFRRTSQWVYPTKLKAAQVKSIFKIKNGGNSEKRDALCLAMPEVLFNLKK